MRPGRFEVESIDGRVRVRAQHPLHGRAERVLGSLRASESRDVGELALDAPARLELRFIAPDGGPLVWLPVEVGHEGRRIGGRIHTDATGRLRIAVPRPGRYTIDVVRPLVRGGLPRLEAKTGSGEQCFELPIHMLTLRTVDNEGNLIGPTHASMREWHIAPGRAVVLGAAREGRALADVVADDGSAAGGFPSVRRVFLMPGSLHLESHTVRGAAPAELLFRTPRFPWRSEREIVIRTIDEVPHGRLRLVLRDETGAEVTGGHEAKLRRAVTGDFTATWTGADALSPRVPAGRYFLDVEYGSEIGMKPGNERAEAAGIAPVTIEAGVVVDLELTVERRGGVMIELVSLPADEGRRGRQWEDVRAVARTRDGREFLLDRSWGPDRLPDAWGSQDTLLAGPRRITGLLPPGPATLRVEAGGHHSVVLDVDVRPGRLRELEARMIRK